MLCADLRSQGDGWRKILSVNLPYGKFAGRRDAAGRLRSQGDGGRKSSR